VDNFLKPIIQKKVGEIHPFLSLIGIIIGISLFGLIGIVIGPLFLSYFPSDSRNVLRGVSF
jgi:predicted PurR-regulated permease PerM